MTFEEESSSLSSSEDDVRHKTAKPKVRNLNNDSSDEFAEFSDDSGLKQRFKPSKRFSFYPASKEKYVDDKPVKKPKYEEDEITFSKLQIAMMLFLLMTMVYVVYEHEYMHVCALKFYANMGNSDAQHILAQRYYLGRGVARNKSLAFYWFQEAAKQGHAHASYNLGVAHLQGFHRLEKKGEAHELIKHAANHGVKEAQQVLDTACAKGECDR